MLKTACRRRGNFWLIGVASGAGLVLFIANPSLWRVIDVDAGEVLRCSLFLLVSACVFWGEINLLVEALVEDAAPCSVETFLFPLTCLVKIKSPCYCTAIPTWAVCGTQGQAFCGEGVTLSTSSRPHGKGCSYAHARACWVCVHPRRVVCNQKYPRDLRNRRSKHINMSFLLYNKPGDFFR